MTSVDVAVIGRGMIGSAAARHLAEAGVSTALIGPGEAQDRAASDGPFCSHCDEGRITRITARTMVWAELAARSIARYRDIEARSGHRFYTGTGLAVVVPALDDWIDAGLVYGSDIRKVEQEWLLDVTGIAIANGLPIGYESRPGGYINPRQLVTAQTRLAEVAGATVVHEAVSAIERSNGGFEASGSWGSITAQRVLLATGAFGRDLIEPELVLRRLPRTVVLGELAAGDPIPSLIVAKPPDDRLQSIYWVPPVPFPDGRTYLKIGGSLVEDRTIEEADLVDWFHSDGHPAEIDALQVSMQALLPNAAFGSFTSTPCVVAETPSEYPYIGFVDDGVAVALGGNGSAAKSSDEIGRLAASLFSPDGWTDTLDQATFEPQLS